MADQDPGGKSRGFDRLHSRCFEDEAIALHLRSAAVGWRRSAAVVRKLLARTGGGIQYVRHVEADGEESFEAACELGLEGIVSKRLTAAYKSSPCKS